MDQFGPFSYDQFHARMLQRGASSLNADLELSGSDERIEIETDVFNVLKEEYPSQPSHYAGFVITGAKASAYDNTPWITRLSREIRRLHGLGSARMVGICFGHQMFAQCLGGRVERNVRGWELAHSTIQLSTVGQKHLRTDRSQLDIFQAHQDHVTRLPDGFDVVAHNEVTPIQGMVSRCGNAFSVQGHPELFPRILRPIISTKPVGEAAQAHALASLSRPTHRLFLARHIVHFLSRGSPTSLVPSAPVHIRLSQMALRSARTMCL